MSKKYFILLAEFMRASKGVHERYQQAALWHDMCCDLASRLSSTNNLFNRSRFLAACGVED